MVGILSKIPPPAQWLNSKASGLAVAAVAASIVVLWKKKLDDLSRKRYFFLSVIAGTSLCSRLRHLLCHILALKSFFHSFR